MYEPGKMGMCNAPAAASLDGDRDWALGWKVPGELGWRDAGRSVALHTNFGAFCVHV